LVKIAGASDELTVSNEVWKWCAIVINKADGDNIRKAKLAKTEFNRALHLFTKDQVGFPQPLPVVITRWNSDVWETIVQFVENHKKAMITFM
jgi:LAO/AO transport system kinase